MKLRLRTRYSVGVNGIVGRKMTVGLVAIAALALPPVARGDESGKPRPAPEVSELVKRAFPYDPAPAQKKEETKEPDARVVTMERFTVVESMRQRQLAENIESEYQKLRDEKFSIRNGGTILKKDIGRTRVELGTWPAGTVVIFLKITW
jgi:cell division septation protein DedD